MSICSGCPAPCCYDRLVPLEDTEDSFESIELLGIQFLKMDKETRACVYLDISSGNCTIWKDRPKACRDFDCLLHGY